LKIFVTGGAGFVGRSLIKSLIEKNHNVTIFDNLSNSSENAIKPFFDKVDFVNGDITNYDDISSSIMGSDVVIHLAAKINVQESIKSESTRRVNVDGTKNLLKACQENNITNVIVASSAAVYSDCKDSKVYLSENVKTNPTSPYGESKLEMEQLIQSFSKKHNLNSIILRIFNVYGKGQSDEYAGVITKFLEKISKNEPLEIFGDGLQTRDFVAIQDVVELICCAISKIEGKQGSIYNIGSGKSISIKELAKYMISISNQNLDIKYLDERKDEIRFSLADISLAKKILNYNPKTEFKNGIKNLMHKVI